MRRHRIVLLFLVGVMISACKKEPMEVFEVAEVFMTNEEAIADFRDQVIDGQAAWKGVLHSNADGRAYGFYLTLSEKGELKMLADLSVQTGQNFTVSRYNLDAKGGAVVLDFAPGSYLDLIYVEEGRHRTAADTSYTVRHMRQDTVVLIGNEHGDELTLLRTTVEERNQYNKAALSFSLFNLSNYFSQNAFHSFVGSDGTAVQFLINQNDRSAVAYYVKDGKLVTTTSYFSYGIDVINFKTPLSIGASAIAQLKFDPEEEWFYADVSTGRLTFIGSRVPIIPLHLFIGKGVSPIISSANPYTYYNMPGWSDRVYEYWRNATERLLSSPYQSVFVLGDFTFYEQHQEMIIDVHFQQGEQTFVARYPYSYQKSDDGIYTFAPFDLNPGDPAQENARLILEYMQPLLDMITATRYKIDYYEHRDEENDWLLGQFIGVDEPDVYFTGFFGSLANQ